MVADYDYTLFRKKKDTRRSSVLLLGLVSFLQNRHLSRLQLNHLIRYDFRPLHLKYTLRTFKGEDTKQLVSSLGDLSLCSCCYTSPSCLAELDS